MKERQTVAVVQWGSGDEVAEAIGQGLSRLGHRPRFFRYDGEIPVDSDVVLTFAPYGNWLQIPRAVAVIPEGRRPLMVHWNFESMPNPKLPWPLLRSVASARSWIGRCQNSDSPWSRFLSKQSPLRLLAARMFRFRYVGDYYYAHQEGLLDLFAETSEIYAAYYRHHGLPAVFVPWGTPVSWYADLALERDIDVTWLGKRRNKRRSVLIDQVREGLSAHGYNMYVADGVERPFVFGEERTRILNRSKLTLNLATVDYDNVLPFRFNTAAGNRSMVVSENCMQHCQVYESGRHYVSAPTEQLINTILHYLQHDDERSQIVENAYTLVTTTLALENSVGRIMELVSSVGRQDPSGQGFPSGVPRG